ncbi:hypothetical protein EV421DRAFT_1737810 [Armillaria borealis]|uniref:Uncharacterized protein n=1 Tax=Armillaria borealis TaxID=47425 RepID=A0AA39MME5_9AGAR|nr:hypothetical protein EV421DRAFT_1737810 [Armillaria borealis]
MSDCKAWMGVRYSCYGADENLIPSTMIVDRLPLRVAEHYSDRPPADCTRTGSRASFYQLCKLYMKLGSSPIERNEKMKKIIKEGFKQMWSALRQRWGTRRVTEARGNILAGEIINPYALNIDNVDFGSRDQNIPSNDMRNSVPAVTTAEEGDVLASVDADKKELSVNENINARAEDTLSETMMEQAAQVWRAGRWVTGGCRHLGQFELRRICPFHQVVIRIMLLELVSGPFPAPQAVSGEIRFWELE